MIKLDFNNYKEYKFNEISFNITERVNPNNTDLNIYVGLEHLDPECIHINRKGKPSDVKGTKFRIYPGDMIFGKRRAYQRKAALADFDGICSAHAMVLRPNSEVILPELFPFFIHSDVFMNRAIDISEGSLSPTIKWKILANEKFKLLPLDEQKRIADLLWSVEKVITSWDISLSKAKILHISLLNSIFGIDFQKTENVGRYIKIKTGKLDVNAGSDDGKYPFFSCSQKVLKINYYDYDCECVLIAGNGDLNVKYYNGKFNAYQRTYIVESKDINKVSNKYLYYFYNYLIGRLKQKAIGGIIKYLRLDDLTNLQLPILSLEEQNKTVNKLDYSKIEIKKIMGQINRIKNIQKQIINKIFG
jgi:type I restriction enzyme, S subunit